METSKPECVRSVHSSSSVIAAPTQKSMDMQSQTPLTHNDKMDIHQTPLTALYVHTVPAAHTHARLQPYPPLQAGPRGGPAATFHLSMLPLVNPKDNNLPLVTLHIAAGAPMQAQQSQQGLMNLQAAPHPLPAAVTVRPCSRSAGKHVCSHCGRDCMKPSVLEKHLRCHTGERPYPCATCRVSFKTQSNLYKHRRTQAHARGLSTATTSSVESEHGGSSSLGSQDSVCSGSAGGVSLDGWSDDQSGSVERDVAAASCDSATQLRKRYATETGCALQTGPVSDNKESSSVSLNECQLTTSSAKEIQMRTEHSKAPPTTHRHLPLQRQEACTLFSVSRGKSQSHDSTDSGFSESSDQYPSPGGVLHDHSMESLAESTLEDLEQPDGGLRGASAQSGQEAGAGGGAGGTSERGHSRTLEERISRLISENSAVVEDTKRLENVRPRKTVLSKQGSIDLPMPYGTYKDSFHFDMRNSSKDHHKVMLDSNRKPGSYGGSAPTQRSTCSVDHHAPLTRSSSLPHNVTLLQPEMSTQPPASSSACRRDHHDAIAPGRGSFGPTDAVAGSSAAKSVDLQHVSGSHHPLVRQSAVDCHPHATEEEQLSTTGGHCDRGDRKCSRRRNKAAKFAYNKWYMYGAGTFKKLYDNNTEKGSGDNVASKAKRLPDNNPEHHDVVHKEPAAIKDSTLNSPNGSAATVCHQSSLPATLNHEAKQPPSTSCTSLKTALLRNPSASTLRLPSYHHSTDSIMVPTEATERSLNKDSRPAALVSQQCVTHIPSDRKKQRTDVKGGTSRLLGTETAPAPHTSSAAHAFHSVTGTVPKQHTHHLSPVNSQSVPPHMRGMLSALCIASAEHLCTPQQAIFIHSTANKSSFLPKYQLELPNTDPLPRTMNVLTSDLSSSSLRDQTSLSITTTLASQGTKKHMDPQHSHSIERTHSSESTHEDNESVFPTTAVTSAARLDHMSTAPCTFTVVHCRRSATITTTTASVQQNRHAKLLGTASVRSSPSSRGGSAPTQCATRPPATATTQSASFAPSTLTTEQKSRPPPPPPAVAVTVSSGGRRQRHPPPAPHAAASHSSTPSSGHERTPTATTAATGTPAGVACQLVRFDPAMEPSAENVFHVHTPDLQICLQIISDEQLALIEPRIERGEGRVAAAAGTTSGLSHDLNFENSQVTTCEYLQSSAVAVMENDASHGKYHEERTGGGHREMSQTEPTSSSKNTASVNRLPPTLMAQKTREEEALVITEGRDVGQAVTAVEPEPLRPRKQTMVKEHVRPEGNVSQVSGVMCLNLSDREELMMENTTVGQLRHHGRQRKPPRETTATTRHVIPLKCQPTAGCERAGSESGGETRTVTADGTGQQRCRGQALLLLHGNVFSPLPNNNCEIPEKVTPQATACGADTAAGGRMVSPGMLLRRSAHADGGGRRRSGAPRPPDSSSQAVTPGESPPPGRVDNTEDHTEDQLQLQQSVRVEVIAVHRVSSELNAAGLIEEEEEEEGEEGGSLAESARPRGGGGGGTPGPPPDGAGRGLKLRQGPEPGERRTHRRRCCVQGRRSAGGALGEQRRRHGVTTKEELLVLHHEGKLESSDGGGCTRRPPLTAWEARAANEATTMESGTHSWLAEEPDSHHLSQIQFGTSDGPPQQTLLQGVSNTSDDNSGSPAAPWSALMGPSQFSWLHCESADQQQPTQPLQTNHPQCCLAQQTQNTDLRQVDFGHQTQQPPVHNAYLQNLQQTASLALSGPLSLSQISNTLTCQSTSICPNDEAHRTPCCLSSGIKPSTSSTGSHSVKVIGHSGRSAHGDGLGTCTAATGPPENITTHPRTPRTPTYDPPQPGDHPDGAGGQQSRGRTSRTGSPPVTASLQGHTNLHTGSPVTASLQGHIMNHTDSPVTTSLQGHTDHTGSSVTTSLQGHIMNHTGSPVTASLQGHTNHTDSPVTASLQGHTDHTDSPVTTSLHGHTNHTDSPVTASLQGHTDHTDSPVTTSLQGHTNHTDSPPVTTLSPTISQCVSPWPGQLHSYQLPEWPSGAARPVQLSSQDYQPDASSSSDDDDEGKLIIEL